MASRLVGTKTLRSFIDTWVGPTSSQGHGWNVTTKFIFYPGTLDKTKFPDEIIPLWNNQAEDNITDISNVAKPLSEALPTRKVTIPADAKAVKLRYLVTGHGQGNLDNCGEFCQLTHTTTVGGKPFSVTPWRKDCIKNPNNKQAGTWQGSRAGWCPGAFVPESIVDVTSAVTPGSDASFSYSITDSSTKMDWVNSCMPGAGDAMNVCQGCAFNSAAGNCDYDNGEHTPPQSRISVQLLVYR